MKKTGTGRFGAMKLLTAALIIVFSVMAFTACSGDDGVVTGISVKEDSVKGYYVVGEFDITSILLDVTYEGGDVNQINATKSMLTTEAANSLKEPGEKNLTINYKGKTAVVKIFLVEDGAQIACVTFNDNGGNELAKKYTLVGGSVEAVTAPTVDGQKFVGWVDSKGNIVDLSAVTGSITVTASYSVTQASYTVRFADYNGKELQSDSVNAGSKITESNAPRVNLSSYPELSSFTWSEKFPFEVTSDITVKMVPEYKTCAVMFGYALESNPTSYTYVKDYGTTVKYGTDVSATAQKMESFLKNAGYEIAKKPSQSTTITQSGMVEFIYIVKDASVQIKVYNDADKNTLVPGYQSPMKIGTVITFPSSAATVSGYALSGWKVSGELGSEEISILENKWTVTKDYGLSVEITPVYASLTVPVIFSFDFKDDKLPDDNTENYRLTLTVSDAFAIGDAVTYQYIDNLLTNISDNKNDYIKLLNGQSVSNSEVVRNVRDNSSRIRETALGKAALYGITVVNVEQTVLVPGGAKLINASSVEFTVSISAATTGITWEKLGTTAYAVAGLGSDYNNENIFIPDTYGNLPVTTIKANALAGKNVTRLSSNLVTIESGALKGATVYGDVVLPALQTIGNNAFEGATVSAEKMEFPVLKTLGTAAFKDVKADGLQINLGSVLTGVGDNTFNGAQGLISVTLPGTVVTVGGYAFCNTALSVITSLAGIKTVGDYAFAGTNLTVIDLPEAEAIGTYAFADNGALTELLIGTNGVPADELVFNVNALTGCVNIQSVSFGAGVSNIEPDKTVFASLKNLDSITVSEGSETYYSNSGVLYAVSGNNYNLIYYPNDKTGSYKAGLPEGASLIVNAGAFANATVAVLDLSSVAGLGFSETTNSVYAVVVAESYKDWAESAFTGAAVVTDSKDADFAYDEDSKLIYKLVTVKSGETSTTTATVVKGYRQAKSITVPEKLGGYNVTEIASGAFASFEYLEELTVLATLKGWNSGILNGTDSLRTLSVKGWSGSYKPELTDFEGNGWFSRHNIIKVGGVLIGYNNNASIGGRAITTVDEDEAAEYFAGGIPAGFFKDSNLTSINLPASVKIINEDAFNGCEYLEEFTAVELTLVGARAFKDCTSLLKAVLNFTGTAAVMYEEVFSGCTSLEEAAIYGEVNKNYIEGTVYYSLPASTFFGCAKLSDLTLEKINEFAKKDGVSNAFNGCESLSEFDFTKFIGKEIPQGAFSGSGLKYAILTSSSLTAIGQEAFSNCSALRYVQLGSSVTSVGAYAFSRCTNLTVELSYDNGGLYEDAVIGENAFPETETFFFISQAVDTAGSDLFTDGNHSATYPIIGFELSDDSKEEMAINFSMTDITTKILIRESDLTAPVFAGYTFAGWYLDSEEYTAVEFPIVIRENCTLYAKYYDERQGSVDASTDVKYVYYLGSTPSVSLDSGENARWYYTVNGGNQIEITELPLVVQANKGDIFKVILTVENSSGVVMSEEYDNLGETGYAIVGYSGTNPSRMSIPNVYDDGTNGSDEIIVVYAGAFKKCIPEEFFIPEYVKAILTGDGTTNDEFVSFIEGTTFGEALKYVTVPAGVEYIADGVFTDANVEEIIFEEGSLLSEVSEKAFFGSKWWSSQLERASQNGGFIIAGNTAIKFVGTADVLLLPAEKETVVTKKFGFPESTEEIDVTVTLYKDDGTIVKESVSVQAETENDGVYRYVIEAATLGISAEFALNTTDSADWTYTVGRNLFILNSAPEDGIALSIASVSDSEVTIPSGVTKLSDGIFKNNTTLKTLIINKELVTIGNEAFADSGLTSVRYGATNSEQYVSSVKEIGTDAFKNTAWYKTEKVILGTIFLKYNNVSGTQALTITESVTKIADGAFRSAPLTSVTVSSSTLKEIGAFAFKGSSISSVSIPKSLEKLGRGAFAECKSLTGINLSETAITELPDEAFKNNSALGAVTMPKTVTKLGKDALSGCTKLSSIVADGIAELSVKDNRFESGLADTEWYKASEAGNAEEDSIIRLGNVLVKYIVGTQSKAVFEETNALTVEIPAGITMIAYKAFSDTTAQYITEIVIPDSVVSIGDSAFEGCSNLITVQIGSGVTEIGNRAFYGLKALKNAVLPVGLLTIGDSAFYGTSLTSVQYDAEGVRIADDGYTVPSTVTEIGADAFNGVTTLTIINLGSSLVKIGARAFNAGNGNLYKVNWTLDINRPMNGEATGLAPIEILAENISNGGQGSGIFVSGMNIRFYTDAATKEYIDDATRFTYSSAWITYGWIFYENGALPTVTPLNQGYNLAPFNSEYIKEGDIPEPPHSTDSSGKTYTFMYWVVVNEGKETRITYPYVVTEDITIDAKFYTNEIDENTPDVNGITFTGENSDTIVSITGISGENQEVLYIPNKIGPRTVTAISVSENEAVKTLILTNAANFNGMTNNIFSEFVALEKIELRYANYQAADFKVEPVVLTATYGEKEYTATFYAVYSNDTASGTNYGTKLIAVIGNVEAATELAKENGYEGEEALDFVFNVPEGVTEIYSEAMVNAGFKTVSLPSTLTAIGDNAFGDTLTTLRVSKKINLINVTRNAIPSDAPIMKKESGTQTTTTDYIEITGLLYKYGNYGEFSAIANVLTGYSSEILEYLGQEGFVMPSTVNGIDITVLASEINAGGEINASVLTLPTNLARINSDAFSGINFKDVLNADGYARLREIASNVFDSTDYYNNNQSTNGLYVGKILIKWENADDSSQIRNDTIAISSNAFRGSQISRVVIPDSVVSIGDNAFYGCVDLIEVTIPNSVTTIGNGAFMACKNLTTVNIDTINSTLATIGDRAFARATSLVTLRLPYSLKTVGENAFNGCSALTTVTFDGYDSVTGMLDETKLSGLTEIGASAFLNAKNLAQIKIPEGITVIKESTFEGCSSLVSVEFVRSSKLTKIENQAFTGCAKLGSVLDVENPDLLTVEMPNSLVSIGYGAFMNCSGMWGISFGHNLYSIGEDVFSGCVNLAKVEMRGATAPSITGTTFGNLSENNYRLRVYVQGDEAGLIKQEYVDKWSSAWDGCGSYIYERGDLPTVKFENSAGVTDEREADVIVNPSANFGTGEISSWQYKSLTQKDGTIGTRTGDIAAYKNQSYVYNDTTYVFLIADYDEVVLTMLSAAG